MLLPMGRFQKMSSPVQASAIMPNATGVLTRFPASCKHATTNTATAKTNKPIIILPMLSLLTGYIRFLIFSFIKLQKSDCHDKKND